MICFLVSKTNEQEEKSYLARRNRHYVGVFRVLFLRSVLCMGVLRSVCFVTCVWCVCLCVCDYFLVDVSSDCLFSFPSLYSQMLYYRLPDFRGLPIFRTPSITVRHSLPSPAIYLVILIMLIRTIFFIFCYFFLCFFLFLFASPSTARIFNHFSNRFAKQVYRHTLEIF